MNFVDTALPGVLIIEPEVSVDEYGYVFDVFDFDRYRRVGIRRPFLQINHVRAKGNVLRGLTFQRNNPQGRLVRVTRGAVFAVAVDVNPYSVACGAYVGVELSDENCRQLWMPAGAAHGFCVTSDVADLEYHCDEPNDPADVAGVIWNDPTIAIPWPTSNPLVSESDATHPALLDYVTAVGFEEGYTQQLAEVLDGLLKDRFGVVPYFIRTRIGEVKRRQLEVWLDRLDGATSLEDVFGGVDSLGFGMAHR